MKPILFNTEMVKAILEGRKTATRRVIKKQPGLQAKLISSNLLPETVEAGAGAVFAWSDGNVRGAPYAVGDILYVRETWTKLYYVDVDGYTHYDQPMYYYAADGTPDITLIDPDGFEEDDQRIRWRPSIHMPKEAARIFLRVTDVRVERLRDITEADAVREGLYKGWQLYDKGSLALSARQAFMWLWETTTCNAPAAASWACNPWVWVISFERIRREEAGA